MVQKRALPSTALPRCRLIQRWYCFRLITVRRLTRCSRGCQAVLHQYPEPEPKAGVRAVFSPGQDGWDKVAYENDSLGMPRLKGSVAALTCERHALHEGGDHSIIVGHVQELVMGETGAPLLYYGGRYRTLGE